MKTACPKCKTMNPITFPDNFLFDRAEYKCDVCGLVESTSTLGNDTSLTELLKILLKIKKQKIYFNRTNKYLGRKQYRKYYD